MSAENSTRETQPPKTMTLSDLEMRDARGPVSNTGTAVFVSGKGRPRVKGGGAPARSNFGSAPTCPHPLTVTRMVRGVF